MPGAFPAQGASAPDLGDTLFHLRQYPGGHTLGVNVHGTPHLLYLGPLTAGQLADLGPLSRWLNEASLDEGRLSGLQMQAMPYIVQISFGNVCNGFQIPHAIRGGANGVPEGLVTTSVRVESGSRSMEFPVDNRYRIAVLTTETDWISQRTRQPGEPIPAGMKEESVLFGRTSACPSFNPLGLDVDLTVFYTLGKRKGQLRTRVKVIPSPTV
jgi:hypothetical protein